MVGLVNAIVLLLERCKSEFFGDRLLLFPGLILQQEANSAACRADAYEITSNQVGDKVDPYVELHQAATKGNCECYSHQESTKNAALHLP